MGRRLVVVESDAELLGMLTDFLTARKFEVVTARTGDEAIKEIRERHPDLVLLSRELPQPDGQVGPDGLRVLKLLKQDRALARIPVIFMADEVSPRDFERYRKLRFSAEDYLKKPFEDTDLLRRIENLIGFDISDSVGEIKSKIETALQPGMERYFQATPAELGEEQAAASRREISDLMAQVSKELERQEQASQKEPPRPRAAKSAGEPAAEAKRLRAELKAAQEEFLAERQRAQELRGKWKKALQVLEARWKESEERESRMHQEMEAMRLRFSDLDLDHTMEVERVHQERRRMEEELLALQEKMQMFAELPANFLEELRHASSTLQSLLERTRLPGKGK
jgi:CheY-like chemotaxis protein